MLTTAQLQTSSPSPPFPVWRFSVEDYHRLIEAGVIDEDDNVELLEGWIVEKMGKNPPHESSVTLSEHAIRVRLPSGWHVRIQCAVTLPDSEPEPDIAVIEGTARDYTSRHPEPKGIALLAEVAESSLQRDRRKGSIYARAEVPVYWIINLIDSQVEVYSDPTGPVDEPKYNQMEVFDADGAVPLVIAGKVVATVPVAELLP